MGLGSELQPPACPDFYRGGRADGAGFAADGRVHHHRGRQRLPDPHYFPEKDKAEQICSGIQAMIANRYSDTNVRVHTEKSTDRLVDAINSMSRK